METIVLLEAKTKILELANAGVQTKSKSENLPQARINSEGTG